jgi:hypothetical protein
VSTDGNRSMNDLPSSSNFPSATPHLADGRASSLRKSESSSDRFWAVMGDPFWLVVVLLAFCERFGSDGFAVPEGSIIAIVGVSVFLGMVSIPNLTRTSERPFAFVGQAGLTSAWPVSELRSAETGDAGSPEYSATSERLGGDGCICNLSAVFEGAAARIGRVCRIGGRAAINVNVRSEQRAAHATAMSRAFARSAGGRSFSSLAAAGAGHLL